MHNSSYMYHHTLSHITTTDGGSWIILWLWLMGEGSVHIYRYGLSFKYDHIRGYCSLLGSGNQGLASKDPFLRTNTGSLTQWNAMRKSNQIVWCMDGMSNFPIQKDCMVRGIDIVCWCSLLVLTNRQLRAVHLTMIYLCCSPCNIQH